MMIKFEVGEQAPAPFWPPHVREGAVLHQDVEGGVYVALYINYPTAEEMEKLTSHRIEARSLADDQGRGLWFLGFGGNFFFELTQDPTLYPQYEWKQRIAGWTKYNLWHIIVIDCSTGTLLHNRVTNAPKNLLDSISSTITTAVNIALTGYDFSRDYKEYLDRAFMRPSQHLWDAAAYCGKFGESVQ